MKPTIILNYSYTPEHPSLIYVFLIYVFLIYVFLTYVFTVAVASFLAQNCQHFHKLPHTNVLYS